MQSKNLIDLNKIWIFFSLEHKFLYNFEWWEKEETQYSLFSIRTIEGMALTLEQQKGEEFLASKIWNC